MIMESNVKDESIIDQDEVRSKENLWKNNTKNFLSLEATATVDDDDDEGCDATKNQAIKSKRGTHKDRVW